MQPPCAKIKWGGLNHNIKDPILYYIRVICGFQSYNKMLFIFQQNLFKVFKNRISQWSHQNQIKTLHGNHPVDEKVHIQISINNTINMHTAPTMLQVFILHI